MKTRVRRMNSVGGWSTHWEPMGWRFDKRLSDRWRRHCSAFAPPVVSASLQTVTGKPSSSWLSSFMPSFRSPYGIKSIRKRTEKSLSKCAAPSSSASPVPTLTGKKSTTYCRRKEQILVDLIIQWWNLNLLWMGHSWIVSPLTSEPHWCRMRIHVLLVFLAAWNHFLVQTESPDALCLLQMGRLHF